MQNLTVIVVTSEINCGSWKQLLEDENYNLLIIDSTSNLNFLLESAIESLRGTKAMHLLVINNPLVISHKFIKYVNYASGRLRNVDLFQIAGGSNFDFLNLTYLRNYRTLLLVIGLSLLPYTLIKVAYKLFMQLPIRGSKKQLISKVAQRHYNNITNLGSGNLYLSNVGNWNRIRLPLDAFFLSTNWLAALKHLQKESILDFDRANIALARSANYNAASKVILF